MCVGLCACESSAQRGQEDVRSLELELQVAVSYPLCVLGSKLQSSARAVSTEPSLQLCWPQF